MATHLEPIGNPAACRIFSSIVSMTFPAANAIESSNAAEFLT
jgi:hypothetical protein